MEKVVDNEFYIRTLRSLFEQRRSKNRNYSLRAFARDLDFDSGNLSRVLKGKHNVSPKLAYRLARELKMEKELIFDFILSTLQ